MCVRSECDQGGERPRKRFDRMRIMMYEMGYLLTTITFALCTDSMTQYDVSTTSTDPFIEKQKRKK